jgi:membrane-associated phospholipid phosphatase
MLPVLVNMHVLPSLIAQVINVLHGFDKAATLVIHEMASGESIPSKFFDWMITYLGLVLYELYVIPGMAIALAYAMAYNHASSLRFHVLPHVLSFSLVGLFKTMMRRPRPGCFYNEIDFENGPKCADYPYPKKKLGPDEKRPSWPKSHAITPVPVTWSKRKGYTYVSFPSGHATVAWAVMTGLFLYMYDEKEKKWTPKDIQGMGWPLSICTFIFALIMLMSQIREARAHASDQHENMTWEPIGKNAVFMSVVVFFFWSLTKNPLKIDLDDPFWQQLVVLVGFGVAVLVSLHRIAKGYHHLFDSICGALFGAAVGLVTYRMWPDPTDTPDTSDAPKAFVWSDPITTMPTVVPRAILGMLGGAYLLFFFHDQLECLSKTGCTTDKLWNLEH